MTATLPLKILQAVAEARAASKERNFSRLVRNLGHLEGLGPLRPRLEVAESRSRQQRCELMHFREADRKAQH